MGNLGRSDNKEREGRREVVRERERGWIGRRGSEMRGKEGKDWEGNRLGGRKGEMEDRRGTV